MACGWAAVRVDEKIPQIYPVLQVWKKGIPKRVVYEDDFSPKGDVFAGKTRHEEDPPLAAVPYVGAPRQVVGLSRVVGPQDVGPNRGTSPGGGAGGPLGFVRRKEGCRGKNRPD